MGLKEFFHGKTKFEQQAVAPEPPLADLRSMMEGRIKAILEDPRRAPEFQARKSAIDDMFAVSAADSDRAVDEQLSGDLNQGAAFKVKRGERQKLRQQRSGDTREALSRTIEGNQASFQALFEALARLQSGTFASEVSSITQDRIAGLDDVLIKNATAAQEIAKGVKGFFPMGGGGGMPMGGG